MGLKVRPARPDDKPALMAIARRIWDGHDYLPVFFDNWVKQDSFWVGVLKPGGRASQQRVVGCGKATRFGPGEWWLEALRVDPDLQGHGLGTRLSMAILQKTLARKPRTIRLATAEHNHDSIHIINRMGFEPIIATRQYRGRISDIPRTGDRGSVLPASAEYAAQELACHPELWLKCGLLSHTWKFKELAPRYLRQIERRGNLLAAHERGRLTGLLIAQPHLYDPRNLDIGFISGPDRALAAFRRFITNSLTETRGNELTATASSPEMSAALLQLGMKPHRGFGRVIVYQHSQTPK